MLRRIDAKLVHCRILNGGSIQSFGVWSVDLYLNVFKYLMLMICFMVVIKKIYGLLVTMSVCHSGDLSVIR